MMRMQPELSSSVNHQVANGSTSYSESWSMHPGSALRLKRGISAKEQQARAKHPLVLPQEIFESRALRKKAFYGDKGCLIFCGEVREVLGWLREAGVFVDCIVTSPPFYGQRDYGIAGQLGLEQKPEEFIAKLVDVFSESRELLHTTGSLWVNLGDTYWNGRGEHKGKDHKQAARRFGLRPQDRRGDGKLCKNKQLLLIPHRFAIAMQDRDWIVRNDNVWVKPNPIPDQVADRSCMSHEYVFHFVTQRFYFYNRVAVGRKTKKGTYMPPADIRNEWFAIDFATWHVGPSPLAPEYIRHRIRSTFVRLGLNQDAYIDERQSVSALYVHRPAEQVDLRLLYPFLTAELERQSQGTNLLDELRELLSPPPV